MSALISFFLFSSFFWALHCDWICKTPHVDVLLFFIITLPLLEEWSTKFLVLKAKRFESIALRSIKISLYSDSSENSLQALN